MPFHKFFLLKRGSTLLTTLQNICLFLKTIWNSASSKHSFSYDPEDLIAEAITEASSALSMSTLEVIGEMTFNFNSGRFRK